MKRLIIVMSMIFYTLGLDAQCVESCKYGCNISESRTYLEDVPYGTDARQVFDISYCGGDCQPNTFPTIVVVHGGGFTAGNKNNIVDGFLSDTWSTGNFEIKTGFECCPYNIVAINYTYLDCPNNDVQIVIEKIGEAVEFLRTNAATYNIDVNSIIMGGYSAGATSAIQLGLQDTNPLAKPNLVFAIRPQPDISNEGWLYVRDNFVDYSTLPYPISTYSCYQGNNYPPEAAWMPDYTWSNIADSSDPPMYLWSNGGYESSFLDRLHAQPNLVAIKSVLDSVGIPNVTTAKDIGYDSGLDFKQWIETAKVTF